MEKEKDDLYELAAAIDFGTTYSGYAYSYRYDRDKIYVNSNWPTGTNLAKVPTACIFNEKQQFIAFGDEAVNKFSDLAESDEEHSYYFFNRFKMNLYQEKSSEKITRDLDLVAANGKTMKAIEVFSASIKYLKNHLIGMLNNRNTANMINENSIRWVLTVPAIWGDSAKQFMREAGEKAGIPHRGLVVALEPEAASLYCQTLPAERMSTAVDFQKVGVKYLVLDNGGGTVDVTVHEILGDNSVKEIYKATGGAWGGTKVDEAFMEYLARMFSKEVIDKVKKNHACDWVDMMEDFEQIKRKAGQSNEKTVTFVLRQCIKDVYEKVYGTDLKSAFENNISLKGASLRGSRIHIPKEVITGMIHTVSQKIRKHTEELLKKPEAEDLNIIMMVGGFSNSSTVVNNIKDLVGEHMTVIVPEEAELSVVKGAVIFGWKPERVKSRKCRMSYGISMVANFKDKVDPERLAFYDDEKIKKCKMVFDKLVEANQELDPKGRISRAYYPVYNHQTEMNIVLYACPREEVRYCDEEDVVKRGVLVVPMPKEEGNKTRKVSVAVCFGDTEFRVEGRDEATGKIVKAEYDFL